MPRVLFLSASFDDYLSDALLHGLRELLGENLVDYPRQDTLYSDYPAEWRQRLYGRGFTLYQGLLEDVAVDRGAVAPQLRDGEFDLVIVADVIRDFGKWVQLAQIARHTRVAVLDGSDFPSFYPYSGVWWRHPMYWLLPRAHRRSFYFKRELQPRTWWFRSFLALPPAIADRLRPPGTLHPTAFSIPSEYVVAQPPPKTKLIATHVVDPEVAERIGHPTSYAFEDQAEYYADLQTSRFGITVKRAGWDCMRHYEQAANGCVPCFRDLDDKPEGCAPHGLDRTNCVIYSNVDELLERIQNMSDDEYRGLQAGALAWARRNTTAARAQQLLDVVGVTA